MQWIYCEPTNVRKQSRKTFWSNWSYWLKCKVACYITSDHLDNKCTSFTEKCGRIETYLQDLFALGCTVSELQIVLQQKT